MCSRYILIVLDKYIKSFVKGEEFEALMLLLMIDGVEPFTLSAFACGWLCRWRCFYFMWAGRAQWLERQTRDWKVTGSNPCRSGGRIFFSMVDFLCWLLFRYPFHPRVTAVAHKRPRSFCQKWRWQVTAKHAHTLRMWLCMMWNGTRLYGVHRTRRDGSSFMWHQPCQRCKYTTSVDIQKCAIKS